MSPSAHPAVPATDDFQSSISHPAGIRLASRSTQITGDRSPSKPGPASRSAMGDIASATNVGASNSDADEQGASRGRASWPYGRRRPIRPQLVYGDAEGRHGIDR